MNLKQYLRGLGLGIIVSTLIVSAGKNGRAAELFVFFEECIKLDFGEWRFPALCHSFQHVEPDFKALHTAARQFCGAHEGIRKRVERGPVSHQRLKVNAAEAAADRLGFRVVFVLFKP